MNTSIRTFALAVACASGISLAHAQTGVSDDRVSLPAGPGSLEGVGENVSVEPNMGMMRYGVPIEVPQGFAGVTPSLRLAYSSGAGSSVVGVGWSLNTPHIERATVFGLPNYTRGDRFTVDGSGELVELPGAAVPTYRARYEGGFVRYSWLDAGDGTEGYWRAEYPDGRVATFGARADGTVVPEARVSGPDGTFRYMMVSMVDVHGHRMDYAYELFGRVSLVRRIDYVFPEGGGPARYSVGFEYGERSDATGFDTLSDAKPGFDERLDQRLAAVNVFSGDDRIRRYQLDYEAYGESGGFTRLRTVAMLGAAGGEYPAVQRFEYSRSLEGVCDDADGCARPFVIDMGNIGVDVGVGRATLIDINGDALPDLVDTSDDGPHQFILNGLVDGQPRFAAEPTASAIGVGSGFRLGTPFVQVLDVNGDGFADLLDARNGRALFNRGGGDWDALEPLAETAAVGEALGADFDQGEGELRSLRFIDIDNDKRIDLLRSTRETTSIWRNLPVDGFVEDEEIDLLGYDLVVDGIQLADMNGDGLLDAVKLNIGGLRYKLNLGHGRWSDEIEVLGLPIDESELDLATLDDINGDGLSDVVVVAGASIRYAINRNGETFSQGAVLASDDVDGELPLRDATVTVLMADINGNGSTDVVWLDAQGRVTALELFPVRPNQLSAVENSLGMRTEVTYTTSVLQAAGEPMAHPLPHPMLVVDRTEQIDLLTDIGEVTTYSYRDGYYDGLEKRFRGFARVEVRTLGDDTQEDGLEIATYDVGAEDNYRHGLMLTRQNFSADRPLGEVSNIYADCPVADVPETTPAIRYICQTGTRTLIMEGAAADEHVAVEQQSTYDGYGNVTLSSNLGVVETGGGACPPCEGGTDVFGAACGETCRGDEQFVETTFIEPGADTNDRWILGAPYRVEVYGDPDSALRSESLIYYDGDAFEGLPLGSLDLGRVTRTTEKLDADGQIVTTGRYRRDADGNVVESIDPLGQPGGDGHRSLYTIGVDGLRVVAMEVPLSDADGTPYALRRELRYEPLFDKVVESTEWMRLDAEGTVRSGRRSTLYAYDEFGRITATARPGDSLDEPTSEYTYDLGNPSSRIITRTRSARGGPLDLEYVDCLDGRGRSFQNRTRIDGDAYQVSGFTFFNVQGQPWRVHQPYVSASDTCDVAPPADVLFAENFRDAAGRVLDAVVPDAALHGEASTAHTRFGPLKITTLDEEDSDPQSPHADTPTVRYMNGIGQMVAFERSLADGVTAVTRTEYDGLGRLSGAIDVDGNVKRQTYDLMGRVVRVDDPNKSGPMTMTFDDASNVLAVEDGRGLIQRYAYDGQNRVVEQWEDADRAGTLETITWDHDPTCDADVCSNTAGERVGTTSPGLDGGVNVVRYGYDLRGRQVRVDRTIEGVSLPTTVAFDNADRVTAVTHPNGQTLEYRYDAASRLVAVEGYLTGVDYDERGLLAGMTYADGTREVQTYDPMARLATRRITNAAGDALQALDYTRDRSGNLLAIEDTAPIGPDLGARFEYDAWYRVTATEMAPGAADGGERLTSTFDLLGNVTGRDSTRDDSPLMLGTYDYTAGPNALTRAGDLELSYDGAGHVAQRGEQSMAWDARGRLRSVDDGDAEIARYAYGTGPRRLAKMEGDSKTLYAGASFELRDGISTLYIRLGANRIARIEDDGLAAVALSDLAPLDGPDGRIDAADAFVSLTADDGAAAGALLNSSVRRMFVDRGPAVSFLFRDHLGSIVMATDGDTGEVIGQRAFQPTGVVRDDGIGYVDAYGFTGQEHDAATGLINFEHRLLDPTTGRWMSADPKFAIATPGDMGRPADALNVYGYVGDNYANAIDPDGLDPKTGTGGGGANANSGGGSRTGKAAKAAGDALKKVGKGICAGCKAISKGLNWKARQLAGDTTTMSYEKLGQKAAKAEGRAKLMRDPKFVKKVQLGLKTMKAAKGAAEITIGATELSAGDPFGALGVVEGSKEVIEAIKDIREISKLDPKNPVDAEKLLKDAPDLLKAAAKHYDKRAKVFRDVQAARVEKQLLDTGFTKLANGDIIRIDKSL